MRKYSIPIEQSFTAPKQELLPTCLLHTCEGNFPQAGGEKQPLNEDFCYEPCLLTKQIGVQPDYAMIKHYIFTQSSCIHKGIRILAYAQNIYQQRSLFSSYYCNAHYMKLNLQAKEIPLVKSKIAKPLGYDQFENESL